MASRLLARRFASTAAAATEKKPINVAVTGAAGAIGYALLMRIASGDMLGPNQPVNLQLIETEPGMKPLSGVTMELADCAFPLLRSVQSTTDLEAGFGDAGLAILVGARPRSKGMERGDLLTANASIFAAQGAALNAAAARDVSVLVVGNPANTNALVASANAPDLSPAQFMAMTRLDQSRAAAAVAAKTGAHVRDVERVVIWGNHSATQYPDLTHATVRGQAALKDIGDDAWVKKTFIPAVQKRGAAIIDARGASSAASAASAAVDHMRDLIVGAGDEWLSMGIPSDGSYGVEEGLWYSVPVTCPGGASTSGSAGSPNPTTFRRA
eukprot:TRINITY_DN1677_c0_g1_i1.p1 TRINITY_DN1677_c0_g1~~TRINITY_DN1677_c0_g1_i1.p1  ORF type:complete len:326 (+),score=117.86 TRINITY_DN1677_c0_g1_i1:131-1108(+)